MDEEGMIDVILDIWRDAWKGTIRIVVYLITKRVTKERNIRKWLLKNIDDEKRNINNTICIWNINRRILRKWKKKKKKMSRFTRMIHRYPHA